MVGLKEIATRNETDSRFKILQGCFGGYGLCTVSIETQEQGVLLLSLSLLPLRNQSGRVDEMLAKMRAQNKVDMELSMPLSNRKGVSEVKATTSAWALKTKQKELIEGFRNDIRDCNIQITRNEWRIVYIELARKCFYEYYATGEKESKWDNQAEKVGRLLGPEAYPHDQKDFDEHLSRHGLSFMDCKRPPTGTRDYGYGYSSHRSKETKITLTVGLISERFNGA